MPELYNLCDYPIADSDAPNNLILRAEKDLERALDALESTGILQCSNRMDLSELLNPACETHDMFDATDQDICDAILEAKKAREDTDFDNSSTTDSKIPLNAAMTHKEALQAVYGLRKYIMDLELDTPFAHTFKTMLGRFGHETCTQGMQNMNNTKITSYFSCT